MMDRKATRASLKERSRGQIGRLLSMFHAPGRTMAGLRASPAIAAVLIASALAGAIGATAVSRAADPEAAARYAWDEQSRAMSGTVSRNLSDADRERALDGVRSGIRMTRNFAPVLGGLSGVLAPVAAAAFFLLVFGVLGAPARYRVLLSTVAHAWWPAAAVSSALTAVVVALSFPMAPERMEEPLRTSLAALAPEASLAMAAFASRFDLFLAWELILVTIGFTLTLGVSRRRSLIVALLLWALVTAVTVGFAMVARFMTVAVGAPPA